METLVDTLNYWAFLSVWTSYYIIQYSCVHVHADDLICKVVKGLPQEIDAIAKQKWDAVLVNQYLSELREAKKRGRKERRHKEAQAVLAAATAAAAASLRISSQRKDVPDEEVVYHVPSKADMLL